MGGGVVGASFYEKPLYPWFDVHVWLYTLKSSFRLSISNIAAAADTPLADKRGRDQSPIFPLIFQLKIARIFVWKSLLQDKNKSWVSNCF